MSKETARLVDRPPFDPDAESMRALGYALVDRLVDHLATLRDQPVAKRGDRAEFEALVDEPLPTEGMGLDDCLDFYFGRVVPRMTRVNHPRFFGYIPCPSSFAGALGEMIAAGTNPFAGSWLGGATIASLELTVLRWLAELVGYPTDAAGILASGGSMANLVALACARQKVAHAALERGVVYISSEGHASLDKAAGILGFKPESVRKIPVGPDSTMQVDALQAAIVADRKAGRVPVFVAANAGTTNAGAIDPLVAIADVCEAEQVWFHVDGAYGGMAAICPEIRPLLRGMERADSLTLDPHKWLYCPMGIGCILVRDAGCLDRAFSTHGHYLRDLPTDEVNFLTRGPELSRPARVVPVWMVIRHAGREGLAAQVRADIALAQLAADLLAEEPNFEVCSRGLSVVTFRHRLGQGETEAERGQRDSQLMEDTLASGELMLSTTLLNGQNTLRLTVLNHRTTEADIRSAVATIRAASNACRDG